MFTLEDMKEWREQRGKEPPLKGEFVVGGVWIDQPPSFTATLDGNPQEQVEIIVSDPVPMYPTSKDPLARRKRCNVFSWEHFKRGKLHNQYPHMLNFQYYRPGVDDVKIWSIMGGPPLKVHGFGKVPIVVGEYAYLVEAYLIETPSDVQGVFCRKFLAENRLTVHSLPNGKQKIVPQS
ncbi:hypothetical protein BGX28_009653 [Mortierella sp. GBA30]|nr:hypothetical protein BGX28_009653 [Mortierella sp. GBA30]